MKFGHIKVPGAVAGYAVLGGVAGASLLSLYGVVLTFMLRSLPDTPAPGASAKCNTKSVDATAYKLKQAMVALLSFTIAPIFIIAIILGASTKGVVRTEIFLLLFAGLSALTIISTSLAYTQVDEVQDNARGNKKVVEGVMIASAISTFVLGVAAVGLIMSKRKQIKEQLTMATMAAKRGDWAAAAHPFIQDKALAALSAGQKTLAGNIPTAPA
jgi:hypothetical protein